MRDDHAKQVFESHAALVWSVIRKHGLPDPDAEDVFMEAWEAVLVALPRFRGESRLSTWIAGITRHKCVDYLRKHREVALDDTNLFEKIDGSGGFRWLYPGLFPAASQPGERAIRGEIAELIDRALAELPPIQRFVTEKWMIGFEYHEIAELLNASGADPVDTNFVGKQLLLAKNRIRSILGKAGIISWQNIWE